MHWFEGWQHLNIPSNSKAIPKPQVYKLNIELYVDFIYALNNIGNILCIKFQYNTEHLIMLLYDFIC